MLTLLSASEKWIWAGGFVLVSAIIIASGFTSADPDSALYAGMAGRLSQEPIASWIAPEWWDFWPAAQMTGLFREHPAGVFWLPAALARLGVPAEQAAYVVGVGAGLASLVLMGLLVERLTSRQDARAALVLLQVMPVAFIFRIRANHEYPMLLSLLLVLLGLHGLRRAWWPGMLVAAGVTAGLLIKGVFVSLVLLAAGLWLLVDPLGTGPRSVRPWIGCAAALAFAGLVAIGYDAWYLWATGETFWSAYLARQLGPLAIASPWAWADATSVLNRLGFYATRLLWHPAPWSLVAVWAALTRFPAVGQLPRRERRALLLALAFAGLAVAGLSLPSRFAERYAFSATFVVGAIGSVAACRMWPALGDAIARLDQRVPALPAAVWTALAVARLTLGPWLPRP